MDYIQKDLELIRMASGEGRAGDKEKKSSKKEKNAGRAGDKEKKSLKKEKKAGDPVRSKSESKIYPKSKTKVARKTLSPKQTKKEKPGLQQKEKNVRRSMGSNVKKSTPALGKIKFPTMKKLTPPLPEKAAHPTRSVKETPPPALPPKVALRIAPSKTRKSLDPNAIPIEGICFEEGAKIEAVDHGQWYRGKIIQVDHQKMDILVHFDGWGSRFDTWFPMTSALIRGRTQVDSKPDIRNYESGEDVLATWTDGNFYPATVLSVKSSGSCQVMYYDGLKKLVRPNLIKKMSEKEKEAAMQAAQKFLLMPPVDIGSPASAGSLADTLTSSKFRKYRTSANDREQRIAARSGTSTPVTTQKPVERGPRRRAIKRKAVSVVEPQTTRNKTPETGTVLTKTPSSKRRISDGETYVTKRARLDKIATNLVSKVSPHSKKDKEKVPQSVTTCIVKLKEKEAKDDSSQSFKHDGEFSTPKAPPAQVSETTDCTTVVDGKKLFSNQENIARLSEQKPKGSTKSQPQIKKDKVDLNESAGTKLKSLAAMVTETVAPSDSTPSRPGGNTFKVGDIVLAKWADCRSYLAYIIKKESHDHYRIRYYDGMVKVVKASFIHPWIGPLPDALKSFKHKAPAAQSIKNRSIDFKSARSKSVTTTTVESKAVLPRRRTIPGAKTEVSPPPVRRRRQSETKETASVSDTIQFAIGEKVVAKWTDLRWYPATIVSKKDNEYYEVRYHDKMTKIVRDTWLNRWAPTPSQKSKSKPARKVSDKSTKTLPETDHGRENSVAERNTEDVEDKTDEQTAAISQGVGQPQILSARTAEGSAQRKAVGWKRFWLVPGSSVLAKFTDGKRYPATVRECLEDQQYAVEFDNGVRCTVKPSMLKPWNPLALPPITKYYNKKLDLPQGSNTASSTVKLPQSPISIKLKVPESDETKEKPARIQSSKPSQMPRQVVRGYQAYYSRLPKQTVDNVERRLFTCRVPQCTKRFRKENMLRQHHKVYHQKRYKLRYHKSDPAPIKRKSLKAEKIRRRVSADYEELSQNVNFLGIPVAKVEKQQPSQASLESSPTVTDVCTETKISAKSEFKDAISSLTPSEFLPSTSKEPTMDKKRARKRRRQTSTKSDGAVESFMEETLTPVEATPPVPEVENEPPPAANEDVIRCSCRSEEEEGLMIQCEGCFTWQHIACIRFDHQDKNESSDDKTIEAENTEDSKSTITKTAADGESYICWVCKNPQNVRKSRKYLYSNDFLLKGKLPSFANIVNTSKKMDKSSKSSFDPTLLSSLLDEVTKMQEALYGIKQKIMLTKAGDENVLLQTWEDLAVTINEKMPIGIDDRKPSFAADKDGDVTPVSTDKTPEKKQEESGFQKRKRKFSNGKGSSLPLKMSGENHEAYILRCRENLLDHIAEMEAELSNRITRLTDFVSTLQSSPDEEEGRSVHDLQRDLSVVQTLLAKC